MLNRDRFSIGLWPLSGDFGSRGLVPDPVSLLVHCLELGYTNFDTAPNYGRGLCEIYLGEAIKRTKCSAISVTTKVGNHRNLLKSYDLDDIKSTFDSTVQTLGVLPRRALIHNPRQSLLELDSLVSSLISWLPSEVSLGISLGKDSSYPANFINSLACTQIDYNYLFKHSLEDSLNVIHARSVFATGLLLKNSLSIISGFGDDDHRSSWVKDDRCYKLSKSVESFIDFCDQASISRLHACLGLPVLDDRVELIILGLKNYLHLQELEHFLSLNLILNKSSLLSQRNNLCIDSGY